MFGFCLEKIPMSGARKRSGKGQEQRDQSKAIEILQASDDGFFTDLG